MTFERAVDLVVARALKAAVTKEVALAVPDKVLAAANADPRLQAANIVVVPLKQKKKAEEEDEA